MRARILIIGAIALLVAACGSPRQIPGQTGAPPSSPSASSDVGTQADTPTPTPTPTPSATPIPTPTPSATPIPTPTAVPTPDGKAAAHRTEVALNNYNKATQAAFKKYGCATLSGCKKWAKASLKPVQDLMTSIQAIEYPSRAAGDAKAFLRWTSETFVLYRWGAQSRTWADWDKRFGPFEDVDRKAAAAAALLRSDLGLPPRL